jgi:hypothetical protein
MHAGVRATVCVKRLSQSSTLTSHDTHCAFPALSCNPRICARRASQRSTKNSDCASSPCPSRYLCLSVLSEAHLKPWLVWLSSAHAHRLTPTRPTAHHTVTRPTLTLRCKGGALRAARHARLRLHRRRAHPQPGARRDARRRRGGTARVLRVPRVPLDSQSGFVCNHVPLTG